LGFWAQGRNPEAQFYQPQFRPSTVDESGKKTHGQQMGFTLYRAMANHTNANA
jgi:hypothetical protein